MQLPESFQTEEAFNPLSLEFGKDPWAVFRDVREQTRCYAHTSSAMRTKSLLRHEDVRAAALDHERFGSDQGPEYKKGSLGDASIMFRDDPPEHTRLRDIVKTVFLPGNIHKLRDRIERRCEELIDECIERGEINFVEDFSAKLTVYVIAEMTGVPQDEAMQIRDWTLRIVPYEGLPTFAPEIPAEWIESTTAVMDEMHEFFVAKVAERAKSPQDDVMSDLMRAGLTQREAISFSKLLTLAGNETTTNLIANAIRLMWRYPDQEAKLRDNPGLVNSMVEEVLRYRGTLRTLHRVARCEMDFDGVHIEPGDYVALWMASANRDPRAIDRPEEFDITRNPNRHTSFGAGIHTCLGNALARLETRIAIEKLYRYADGFEITRPEGIENHQNPILDGVKNIPARILPGSL